MANKIGPRTYKLMWDAHSISGIVVGLALFVLFFTGALMLFRGELRQWEEPALRAQEASSTSIESLTRPVLDSVGSGAPPSYVYIDVPGNGRDNLRMYLSGGDLVAPTNVWVNPGSGEWVAHPEAGQATHTLYFLHFFFQLGTWGLYLAGAIGLLALFSIATGIVVHFDRLVTDFVQFRPRKQLRVAWADAHKVLGTIGLPFSAMYALTGAYFGLVGLLALMYSGVLLDGDTAQFYREAGYYGPYARADSAAPSGEEPELDRLAARTAEPWSDFRVETIIVYHPGAADARVEVVGRPHGAVFAGTGAATFHARTGEELARRSPDAPGAFNEVVQSMEVLHFGAFGGLALKILFFLLALGTCAVILTGNLTWIEIRRRRDRLLEKALARLTAGIATGLLPATALLLLAGRVLLNDVETASWWANTVFFGVWGACALYAVVRSSVARTHRSLLVAGGLTALLLPVANGLTTGDWPWVAWELGRWSTLGVDVGATVCGIAALGIARSLRVESDPRTSTPARTRERARALKPTEGSVPSA